MRLPCWILGHEWRQSTPSQDGMAFVKCVECGRATLTAIPPDFERDAALVELSLNLALSLTDNAGAGMERAIREALRPLPRVAV